MRRCKKPHLPKNGVRTSLTRDFQFVSYLYTLMTKRGTGLSPVNAGEEHAQDARATVKKRHGAYLPHWTIDSAWYAVTFRLWDSLPQRVVESWLFERKNIIKTAEQMNRPLSKHEEDRLRHLYSEKVE